MCLCEGTCGTNWYASGQIRSRLLESVSIFHKSKSKMAIKNIDYNTLPKRPESIIQSVPINALQTKRIKLACFRFLRFYFDVFQCCMAYYITSLQLSNTFHFSQCSSILIETMNYGGAHRKSNFSPLSSISGIFIFRLPQYSSYTYTIHQHTIEICSWRMIIYGIHLVHPHID